MNKIVIGLKNLTIKKELSINAETFHFEEHNYYVRDLDLNIKQSEIVGFLSDSKTTKVIFEEIRHQNYIQTYVDGEVGLVNNDIELSGNVFVKNILEKISEDAVDFIGHSTGILNIKVRDLNETDKLLFSLCLALFSDKEILLLENVLENISTYHRIKALILIKQLSDNGCTIVISSTKESLLKDLCNRAIVVKDEKVFYDGDVGKAIDINNNDEVFESDIESYNTFGNLTINKEYEDDSIEFIKQETINEDADYNIEKEEHVSINHNNIEEDLFAKIEENSEHVLTEDTNEIEKVIKDIEDDYDDKISDIKNRLDNDEEKEMNIPTPDLEEIKRLTREINEE